MKQFSLTAKLPYFGTKYVWSIYQTHCQDFIYLQVANLCFAFSHLKGKTPHDELTFYETWVHHLLRVNALARCIFTKRRKILCTTVQLKCQTVLPSFMFHGVKEASKQQSRLSLYVAEWNPRVPELTNGEGEGVEEKEMYQRDKVKWRNIVYYR